MKKFLTLVLSLIFSLALTIGALPALADEEAEAVLRVYNWQDYIYDGTDEDGRKVDKSVMELWEEDYESRTGKKARIQYDTFETNETMLNTLRTGKTQYDLVCPSDYIIQKMLLETQSGSDEKIMLEKYDLSKMPNYTANLSPYISDLFEKNGWTDYAVGYMWGSVGILYNPEAIKNEKDVTSWDILWNPEYKNATTCKDTSRDAYVIGLLKVYGEELRANRAKYDSGEITGEELQSRTQEIVNRVDDKSIEKVEEALKEMKENIYGFEVDSGKSDIVTGKIDANVAWSGDAVYSMDLAEEEDGKELCYVVPDEGSTIWFDGWVMPKGANTELAQDFVNFLCRSDIAAMNVDFIGYTSAIAGDDIFDLMLDRYDEEGGEPYDLSYFFGDTLSDDRLTGGKAIIRTSEKNRQLQAQYPDMDTTYRCGVMEDFGDQNEKVLTAWGKVKGSALPVWIYILVAAAVIAVIAVPIFMGSKGKKKKRR